MNKFKIKAVTKTIKIPTKNGELSLPSNELSDIFLWTNSSSKIQLSYLPSKTPRTKTSFFNRKAAWVVLSIAGSKLEMYEGGQMYNMKNNYLEIKSVGQKGFVGIGYYFKKTNEDYIVYIGDNIPGTINASTYLKSLAYSYFSECPSLATKIIDKEFKLKDKEEILDFYNNQCE